MPNALQGPSQKQMSLYVQGSVFQKRSLKISNLGVVYRGYTPTPPL